jgi:primosomal protein N' (replication factor Y)
MTLRETDILIGTQMVTKGLDLPHVSLVGVLLADQALHIPDFRAAERTFQLLTQVVGRAGRGEKKGRAMIQTFQPEHYSIQSAAHQDYESFYAKEIEFRRQLQYPPFQHLALIELSGPNRAEVASLAKWLGEQSRRVNSIEGLDFLGPAPAPIQKIAGNTRFHLMIRSPNPKNLEAFAKWMTRETKEALSKRSVDLKLTLDPIHFL